MDTCSRTSISRRSLLASTAALLIAGTTTGRARTINQELPFEPGMATPPVPVRPWSLDLPPMRRRWSKPWSIA